MKPTAERILDEAEALFAEKGYEATSLGDVADRVGIRSPSLYNHYRNKESLYAAVVDRLLERFKAPIVEMIERPVVELADVLRWQERMMRMHIENPNLARLLQHAALSGGPQAGELFERLAKPLFMGGAHLISNETSWAHERPVMAHLGVINIMNMVTAYVTMAPMYKDLLGRDPFCEEMADKQVQFLHFLTELFWKALSPDGGRTLPVESVG